MPTSQNILVAVVGLTPQVITETVYYLTQVRQPPVLLNAIHVLTTQRGQEQVSSQLLAPAGGQFYALCTEYGLDASAINVHIHVLRDAAHEVLDDMRTAADNLAVADQIAACIQHLTSNPTTRLFCSLAGGRKTQSVLLGFALQLYGRSQDSLLHVLVDGAVENHPEFFYPPRTTRWLRTHDGQWLDAHTARIDVAEIPYVRLRDKLFTASASGAIGFGSTIVQGQRLLDALPDLPLLVIRSPSRRIAIGPTELSLPPLEFMLYAHLAQLRRHYTPNQGGDGFVTLAELDETRDQLLHRYAALYSPHSGRVETVRKQWDRALPRDNVRSHFANINHKVHQAIPDATRAFFYLVSSEGAYGNTRYGLRLPPEKIVLEPQER